MLQEKFLKLMFLMSMCIITLPFFMVMFSEEKSKQKRLTEIPHYGTLESEDKTKDEPFKKKVKKTKKK